MTISTVRKAVLGLAIFLAGWFWIVSALQDDSREAPGPAADPASLLSAEARERIVSEEAARLEAEQQAAAAARQTAIDAIAKELAMLDYMQPPFVEASARAGLARQAASLIVSGRCTRSDLEHWGWAKASLAGNPGDYFTYCDAGGAPKIVYVSPS